MWNQAKLILLASGKQTASWVGTVYVEKWKIYSYPKNILSNQFFGIFLCKNVTFA